MKSIRNWLEHKQMAVIGIGSGVIIYLITLFFTSLVFSDIVMRLGVALVATAIPYLLWIFPHCVCFVPADKAWVLTNSFKKESAGENVVFSGYREISAQRELQAGPAWKYPWEKPDKEIDMTRKMTIQSDKGDIYTLKDKKTMILITWRVFYGPLTGNIVNYIKTRPEHTETRVRDRVRKFIQGYVGDKDAIGFGKAQQEELRTRFEKIYGGPAEIDDEERALGIWTHTPEIIDIDQPREVEEINNILGAVQKMVKESGNKLTYHDAANLILAAGARGVHTDVLKII